MLNTGAWKSIRISWKIKFAYEKDLFTKFSMNFVFNYRVLCSRHGGVSIDPLARDPIIVLSVRSTGVVPQTPITLNFLPLFCGI